MDVVLPKIALTMTEAVIVEWHKHEGDSVVQGEPLLSIETDKTDVEVEAPGSGVLSKLRYAVGDTVQAGEVVALIEVGGDAPVELAVPRSAPTREWSPAAETLARELGIDPVTVRGTGPGGRVLETDVLRDQTRVSASTQASAAPQDGGVERVSPTRARAAGLKLTEHATRIPTFFLFGSLDLSDIRDTMSEIGITVTDALAIASAAALKDVPAANAFSRDGDVYRYSKPRVGILVRHDDALIPLVFDDPSDVPARAFRRLRSEAADLLASGRLPASQMSGATFVISNLGRYDVDAFTAVLFPDTGVTLAVGSLGADAARPHSVRVALTCDHRVLDGVDAAEFLNALKTRIGDEGLFAKGGDET